MNSTSPSTTFKPPLRDEELRDIGRRKDPADIVRLLWEIKRLQSIALRADQLQGAIGPAGGAVGMVLGALRNDLAELPCVLARRAERLAFEKKR
jgi:hypothetical protein